MLAIIHCDDNQQKDWDQFVRSHHSASFYHLFGWKNANEEDFGHETFYLAAKRNDRIVGIFPLVFIDSLLFGKILSSMPFVNYGGICAKDSEAEQALLDEAKKLVRYHGIDYLEIRSIEKLGYGLATSAHKISMSLSLHSDPDTLWNGFKSKHRTNIRRVYKEGISVRQGGIELLDAFYQVLSESWKSLGTPIYRKSYFQSLLRIFGDALRIFIAERNGQAIAVAFNANFKDTVEGMWAGSLAQYRQLQPNYVLYWEMMKDSCERGFQHYHLGRSTVGSGAEDFKKKWNAEPRQLYWQYILHKRQEMPQLNVNNPKFQLAIQAWQKLPTPVTQWIGPLVSKYIP